jgi:site-specific DNA recombinase
VRRAFELYATGRYNLHTLQAEMQRAGLTNRRGAEVSINSLAAMLRNPFYIGLIRVKRRKETYEGAHDPLVKKSLFDRVQAVLDGKLSARPERHDFLLRSTVRCTACGYALIGETQKGHTYYRCHTRSCPPDHHERGCCRAEGEPGLPGLPARSRGARAPTSARGSRA